MSWPTLTCSFPFMRSHSDQNCTTAAPVVIWDTNTNAVMSSVGSIAWNQYPHNSVEVWHWMPHWTMINDKSCCVVQWVNVHRRFDSNIDFSIGFIIDLRRVTSKVGAEANNTFGFQLSCAWLNDWLLHIWPSTTERFVRWELILCFCVRFAEKCWNFWHLFLLPPTPHAHVPFQQSTIELSILCKRRNSRFDFHATTSSEERKFAMKKYRNA